MLLSIQETKDKWSALNAERVADGREPLKPSINLALFIASNALIEEVQWSGEDYMEHPLVVGMSKTDSTTKQIIGILHDVVEDSDWTLEDFEELGFDERIINGVDGVTKRPGEGYFTFVERCGTSGSDAIDVKLRDLTHNSQNTRAPVVDKNEKASLKADVYNISFFYLVGIKKGEVEPGTSIEDFVKNSPDYANKADYVMNTLYPKFETFANDDKPSSTGDANAAFTA